MTNAADRAFPALQLVQVDRIAQQEQLAIPSHTSTNTSPARVASSTAACDSSAAYTTMTGAPGGPRNVTKLVEAAGKNNLKDASGKSVW